MTTESRRLDWGLWVALVVWSALFGPPALPGLGFLDAAETPFIALAIVVIGSTLLSYLVSVSLVRCLTQRVPTFGAITAPTFAMATFCALVGGAFLVHSVSQRMATRFSFALEPSSLDRAQQQSCPGGGRIGAGIVYRELGLRVVYQDDAGATLVFEPTSAEQKARAENIAQQQAMVRNQAAFEDDVHLRYVSAWTLLLSFPLVFAVCLLWWKRRWHEQLAGGEMDANRYSLSAPWALTAAWFAAFGLPPGESKAGLITRLGDNAWWPIAVVGVAAFSWAATATLTQVLARRTWTYGALAAAVASVTATFLLVGLLSYLGSEREDFIGATRPHAWIEPGRLDRIHDLKNRKSGRLAARMMFHEFGWRTGYLDEAGAIVAFEPTADEQRRRASTAKVRQELAAAVIALEERLEGARTFVWLLLAAFPFSLALNLLWRRRRAAVPPPVVAA